jgi:hypothetical protein
VLRLVTIESAATKRGASNVIVATKVEIQQPARIQTARLMTTVFAVTLRGRVIASAACLGSQESKSSGGHKPADTSVARRRDSSGRPLFAVTLHGARDRERRLSRMTGEEEFRRSQTC